MAMRYEAEVRHDGLGKYRHITGSNRHVVIQKVEALKRQWDDQWERLQEKDRLASAKQKETKQLANQKQAAQVAKVKSKEEVTRYKESRKQEAVDRTAAAQAELDSLQNTLAHTLTVNDAIDWGSLKDTSSFPERKFKFVDPPKPNWIAEPHPPVPPKFPTKPVETDARYRPEIGLLDMLISSRKAEKIAAARKRFEADSEDWEQACVDAHKAFSTRAKLWQAQKTETEEKNTKLRSEWGALVESKKQQHEQNIAAWKSLRTAFLAKQKETNLAIKQSHDDYMTCSPGAVTDYCEMVLGNSVYPDSFPKEWDIEYLADTRTLVIEYVLPPPEAVPTLKEVQYVQSRDDFKESFLSDKERDALYDALLYQLTLRTLHELFEADVANALDAVVFNGLVTTIDKAVGKEVTSCIVSVQAGKDEFMAINLANVDPKSCFKSLKGVAAAKLSGLAPVAPILMIDKTDRRFVNSYAVADRLSAGDNLASMDWEDFEHLIRELFEKEFAAGGGEVRVTQASRDGGVDAVVFDPDPIRGGKIVIQAKRYSNTVGVSAVRDLYGTMINEGAMKGILVSTANYGPDAYMFAKGKPLTLLNGGNLLHLLGKHGHQARIDLTEAKMLAKGV